MSQRFYSLDVFRGATVALMILVNNPGSWSHIYAPLEHASWHGCTPTDIVFPFFLFAVGNSMAFVMPRMEAAGKSAFLRKVIQRTLLIFGIGLLLNWFPFVRWYEDHLVAKSISSIRIFGVLQRIGLCYFLGSVIVFFYGKKGAVVASVTLLLAYWILSRWLGNPADPYSLEGFWGTPIDRALLGNGHIYKGEGVPFDPEGLVSTIPAIVNVLIGFLAGQYIQLKGKTYEMITKLFVAGTLLVFLGFCLDMVFPINKKIWTSSFVLYTSGLGVNVLAMLLYLIEIRKYKTTATHFFDVFGKNPLFIFVLSGLLPRLLALIRINNGLDVKGRIAYTTPFGWFYEHICNPVFTNPNNASLFYAICIVVCYWLIAKFLDRKKIYIRV